MLFLQAKVLRPIRAVRNIITLPGRGNAATLHSALVSVPFKFSNALDCVGLLRHFLYLFQRIRIEYLDAYQRLVLGDHDPAANGTLKEVFLVLQLAAESG